MRVHYARTDAAYTGWGVYSWEGPRTPSSAWPDTGRFVFTQADSYGRYVDIPLDTSKSALKFLVTKPNAGGTDAEKDCSSDMTAAFAADVASKGQEIWLKQGDCTVYATKAAATGIDVSAARAMWLAADTIVWPGADTGSSFRLYYAANGGIKVDPDAGVTGADGSYDLAAGTLSDALKTRFRALASAPAFTLPAAAVAQAKSLLKGEVVIVRIANGKPAAGTQLQTQGVLDDLYAAAATAQTLGLSFAGDGTPSFRLWAPTARSVKLLVNGNAFDMSEDSASGVWSATGDKAWTQSAYYTYRVQVYSRADGGVVSNDTTDPYAVTLDANGSAAMVADLSAASLKPAGWATQPIPALAQPTDSVLYELHVRDFSANDATVPATHRGKYLAFTDTAADGMKHLQALAQAGLTHVHLLPVFDIASVNEAGCTTPAIAADGATSEAPQAAATAAKDTDCFNWGYDPAHYGAPEGSYATDAANGATRVLELRQMVQSLHATGLRVVMDVVYNHTSGNRLDKIVPGYYYRLNGDGGIEKSTCCENTAPEFAMMEKLMIDTLKTWAVQYQVDGFRFDIMGHIPKSSMVKARADVDAAAGRALYYYGEAWNFGEVQDDRLFVQARQANMAGTGIGSFNDRIRDAIRGGGPFDNGADLEKNQGFVSGRCYDNNELNTGACTDAQRSNLQYMQDLIRYSMAGNIADFTLNGVKASDFLYGGQPAGFTQDPQEVINYAGVHDGQTLWDISQYKHPAGTTAAERARAQVVALGTVLMAQGVPFLHAGDELLRSKSFDADSYNSGDWFNRVDWTGSTNYWGEMGLPPAEKNQANWELMKPLLAGTAARPAAADIQATNNAVLDLLKVRKSSSMFRLASGADVKACVSFPDAAAQQDGLVVMRIAGNRAGGASCGDGAYASVLVFINASSIAQDFTSADSAGKAYALHPVLAAGSDARVKTATFDAAGGRFNLPARTVAVFVESR
jgi:pullulanase-type alpha-1,6-glucosidase